VESLLYYDHEGPVFTEPGPVIDFLITRAHLWMTVYYSPQSRFRTVLLRELVQGVKTVPKAATIFLCNSLPELSLEDFGHLDDVSLASRILELSAARPVSGSLPENARTALAILVDASKTQYEHFWLVDPKDSKVEAYSDSLPDDLFFDTFKGQRRMFQCGAIRVQATPFRYLKGGEGPLPLESCAGPFRKSLEDAGGTGLMLEGAVLLFIPRDVESRPEDAWRRLTAALRDAPATVWKRLQDADPSAVDIRTSKRSPTPMEGEGSGRKHNA
jgi:hypothetical protein